MALFGRGSGNWLTSAAGRRLLPEGWLSGPMPWVIAIMMFLMVLAAAAGLALGFGVTALAGSLMVSQFAYPSFKGKSGENGANRRVKFASLLFVPLFFIAVASNPPVVLLAFSGTFALSAPLLWVFRKLFRRRRETGEA